MKRTLIAIALASFLAACSSTKTAGTVDSGSVTAINAQKLETTFKRRGVKLEWECTWGTGSFGITDAMCVKGDIKAVEVTGYAPSYGNSEVMRENAFKVAEMQAKAKLRRFIQEDVSTTQVQTVLAKSVEKANDRIKSRIKTDEVVSMSEEDANKETNWAVRSNTNDTTRTVTETIYVNAQGILKGVRVIDEQIVDRQTVAVVIRWDKENERGAKSLRKAFGN